jgi:hypothetical protein
VLPTPFVCILLVPRASKVKLSRRFVVQESGAYSSYEQIDTGDGSGGGDDDGDGDGGADGDYSGMDRVE